MTLSPITDDFEHRSDLAVRAPWQVGRDEHLLELRHELDRRRSVYRGLVDRNTITVDQARRYCAILKGAIARYDPRADLPAEAVSHDDIVRELRRELMIRRNAYPKWVRSPTSDMTADSAASHIERLDAVHWSFWMELEHFTPGGFDAEVRDLARHATVVRLELAARAKAWDYGIAAGGDAATTAIAERQGWVDLARLIDALGDGERLLSIVQPPRLAALRDLVQSAGDAALDACCADAGAAWRFARLCPLAQWIQRLALAPCGPAAAVAIEHREAA